MAKASARPRLGWEQLPESSQRIYLALAEGDPQRARQLHEHDQRPRGRRRAGGVTAAAAAKAPARDLRGFVARGRRLVPRDMADAEAWKRRQARQ
ncbi:MAG TPA: hypothetical protein VF880_15700 [Actinomycetes bacterium]|jgi:hypothetical protein